MASPATSSLTFRALLRAPASLRPLLFISSPPRAFYHSQDQPEPQPYRAIESNILSSALSHVPHHGFTSTSLTLGTKDAGYLDISTNLFPRGAFEIVAFYLATRRLELKTRVQLPSESGKLDIREKVRRLVLERLRANAEADVVGKWQEALALMSHVENVPASLRELALLSDEIWFLAGDVAVDASWYTKRTGLAGVYAATEVFQTTDQSTDFRDTEEFLDRRLEEFRVVRSAVNNTAEWLGFQGGAFVNLLRSKGVRI